MAYYLTLFGPIILPLLQPITEMPTAPPQEGATPTLGTGYDAWGGDIAPATFPYPLQYRVLVLGTTAAAYMTTVNELRALARQRRYLYRTGQDDSAHRALARLEQVTATDSVETFNAVELSFRFLIWSHWENNWDLSWALDEGFFLNTGLFLDAATTITTLSASPQDVTVTAGGNIAVDDIIITLTAGGAPITKVVFLNAAAGLNWEWAGTLAASKILTIDTGTWRVLNDGADAWAGFAFLASHARENIMRFQPGSNSITVTLTGGSTNSTLSFDFTDWWS